MCNTINDFAFYNTLLEKIIIPPAVKRLGELSFAVCYNLEKVYISNDSELEEIDDCAFDCSAIRSIFIPSKVRKIGNYVFPSCEKLCIVEFDENSKLNLQEICKAQFSDPFPVILAPAGKNRLK